MVFSPVPCLFQWRVNALSSLRTFQRHHFCRWCFSDLRLRIRTVALLPSRYHIVGSDTPPTTTIAAADIPHQAWLNRYFHGKPPAWWTCSGADVGLMQPFDEASPKLASAVDKAFLSNYSGSFRQAVDGSAEACHPPDSCSLHTVWVRRSRTHGIGLVDCS